MGFDADRLNAALDDPNDARRVARSEILVRQENTPESLFFSQPSNQRALCALSP